MSSPHSTGDARRQRTKSACGIPPPLHQCLHCGSPYVQPLSMMNAQDDHIAVKLWCPECFAWMAGTFPSDQVRSFQHHYRQGYSEIKYLYHRKVSSNMANAAASFTRALELDLITADDFAPAHTRRR